jgi:hypothetical protein
MEDIKIEEGVLVRKGKLGYRLIYPYKRADGSINWFNALCGGSWWNFGVTLFIVLAIFVSVYSYKHDIAIYKNVTDQCYTEPCKWCDIITANNLQKSKFEINLTILDHLEVIDDG